MIPYIVTDLHFNHKAKMIEYCNRPSNYEQLLYNSLKTLSSKHLLICLGDICIGNDTYVHNTYIKPLHCKKILVRGNHDHHSDSWYYSHGWDFVCEAYENTFYKKHLLFTHKPTIPSKGYTLNIHGHLHNELGKNEVYRYLDQHLLLSHEHEGYRAVSLQSFLQKHLL